MPMWTAGGWNADMELPYEALGVDSPDGMARPRPVVRYRAMACARQLYVFSRQPGGEAHADALFATLRRWFADPRGGWYYSVDAAGAPLDTSKDLYTHAFVVFACAAYFRRSRNADAKAVIDATVALLEDRFADGRGLYRAALAQDFGRSAQSGDIVLQNPIMHLTEAYLAVHALSGDVWFADRLRQIGDAMLARFVDSASGCVAELEQGQPGNRVEPGHQFEWFSLATMAPAVFGGSALAASLDRAFRFAFAHGVDPITQGVAAALDADGTLADGTQRIWAQTEYARALALRADEGVTDVASALAAWYVRFPERFLHPQGWREVIAPDGTVLRDEMPSTTPYHLATAYEAIRARQG